MRKVYLIYEIFIPDDRPSTKLLAVFDSPDSAAKYVASVKEEREEREENWFIKDIIFRNRNRKD